MIPPGPRGLRGRAGWTPAALVAASLALTALVGLLGPSSVVLTLAHDSAAAPPWHLDTHPAAWLVVPLTLLALVLGGLGLLAALLALRRGWVPRAGRWVLGATAAVLATVGLPPASTADPLIYAAYGRLAALGADPYVLTPRALILVHDPVGVATEGPWQQVTSVYGPLATAQEELASRLGGTSTALTVLWLQVGNVLGWLVAGVLLLVLAHAGGAAARSRVVLLWWANPLLLWAVLTGGHNDAIAAAFVVAALLLLGRSALLSGLAIGGAGTVKLTDCLLAAGLLWAVRRQPRAALALVAGVALVLVPTYVPVLPEAFAQTGNARGYLSSSSPWRLVKVVTGWFGGGTTTNTVLSDLSWVAVLALAVVTARQVAPALIARGVPRAPGRAPAAVPLRRSRLRGPGAWLAGDGGGRATGPARVAEAAQVGFAVALGWLVAGYYTLPWYDLQAWIPLCLLAASALDLVLLVRTTLICLAYAATRTLPPEEAVPGHLLQITQWIQRDLNPWAHVLLAAFLILRLRRPSQLSRPRWIGRDAPWRRRTPETGQPGGGAPWRRRTPETADPRNGPRAGGAPTGTPAGR